jgi:hypothetical protein
LGYKVDNPGGGAKHIERAGKEQVKPDILLSYPEAEDGFAERPERAAYAVVYVRPETNTILYERAIASGIRKRGDTVIYTANLNGSLFLRDRILESHYAAQFRFAEDPRGELLRYPQIAGRVQEHFGIDIERASLVGPFEAVTRLGVSEEMLFGTFLPEEEFLSCWGQQFMRFGGTIVVNPHLPAILKRYSPSANVFVVAVRSRDGSPDFFPALNKAIYDEITSRVETPILHGGTLEHLAWPERIRRTYHISRTHLMALFDMSDFVYLSENSRLDASRTPLGRELIRSGAATAEVLNAVKRQPLAFARRGDATALEYLPLSCEGQGVEAVRDLLRRL